MGIGSRHLLARNRQNAVNDSDASSISSGVSHTVTDDTEALIQSTASTRPSTSAASPSRTNHSQQSVFAEVHQSTEMLKKRMEAKNQKRNDDPTQISNVIVHHDNHDHTAQNVHSSVVDAENTAICQSERNSHMNDIEGITLNARNPSVSDQLVVVVDDGSSDTTTGPNEDHDCDDDDDHITV